MHLDQNISGDFIKFTRRLVTDLNELGFTVYHQTLEKKSEATLTTCDPVPDARMHFAMFSNPANARG